MQKFSGHLTSLSLTLHSFKWKWKHFNSQELNRAQSMALSGNCQGHSWCRRPFRLFYELGPQSNSHPLQNTWVCLNTSHLGICGFTVHLFGGTIYVLTQWDFSYAVPLVCHNPSSLKPCPFPLNLNHFRPLLSTQYLSLSNIHVFVLGETSMNRMFKQQHNFLQSYSMGLTTAWNKTRSESLNLCKWKDKNKATTTTTKKKVFQA